MKIVYIVFVLAILVAQAYWIFLDARKRGENYWLWGIFGLLNVPSSLIIYLLVTRNTKVNCPNCGERIKKGNDRCPYCSTKL
mgnify:CR=1 FL=1